MCLRKELRSQTSPGSAVWVVRRWQQELLTLTDPNKVLGARTPCRVLVNLGAVYIFQSLLTVLDELKKIFYQHLGKAVCWMDTLHHCDRIPEKAI